YPCNLLWHPFLPLDCIALSIALEFCIDDGAVEAGLVRKGIPRLTSDIAVAANPHAISKFESILDTFLLLSVLNRLLRLCFLFRPPLFPLFPAEVLSIREPVPPKNPSGSLPCTAPETMVERAPWPTLLSRPQWPDRASSSDTEASHKAS